jgi:sugar lactone lactonase YvrE
VGIAVDASGVYWVNSGSGEVLKTSKSGGGAPVTLASGQKSPVDVAVDGAFVYWTSTAGGTVAKVALDGSGEAVVIAEGQKQPEGIAVDGAFVYWTNIDDASVVKVDKNGGAPVVLASFAGPGITIAPWSVAVDASRVFFTTNGLGTVESTSKN